MSNDLKNCENWGEVELYRMQHGELPGGENEKELDYVVALRAAAKKVANAEVSPFNAAAMLMAVAQHLEISRPKLEAIIKHQSDDAISHGDIFIFKK